ncbi:MAG TPA: hypothetical protein VKK31_29755 [Thermoanaerobaculia bacterium]|nr:hypothetical protein [Thermoanaerobaculia bacterium]
MNVNLHIDRLILDGIDVGPAQRPVLQAAVEAELGRLFMEGGMGESLTVGGALPSLRAEGFQMSGDGNPARLGRQIARAVYGGIGK